jgi:hypothetical protein
MNLNKKLKNKISRLNVLMVNMKSGIWQSFSPIVKTTVLESKNVPTYKDNLRSTSGLITV